MNYQGITIYRKCALHDGYKPCIQQDRCEHGCGFNKQVIRVLRA